MSKDEMCGICSNDVLVNRRHVAKLQAELHEAKIDVEETHTVCADICMDYIQEIRRLKEKVERSRIRTLDLCDVIDPLLKEYTNTNDLQVMVQTIRKQEQTLKESESE